MAKRKDVTEEELAEFVRKVEDFGDEIAPFVERLTSTITEFAEPAGAASTIYATSRPLDDAVRHLVRVARLAEDRRRLAAEMIKRS